QYHRTQMIDSLKVSTTNLSKLVQKGLEYPMSENRLDVIREMVDSLSKEEGVKGVLIFDKRGTIKIASRRELEGRVVDLKEPTCQICHQLTPKSRSTTVIFETGDGSKVFRNVNPIANSPPCFRCHSPRDKTNGVLIMDFSMDRINRQLASNIRDMFVFSALMVVIMILVVALILNRMVIRKLKKFLRYTEVIGKGKLDEEVKIGGRDEMAQLANHFNTMTASLRRSIKEAERHKKYLENMINSIDDEIMVVDRDFKVVTVNNTFLSSTNQTKEEVIGQPCYVVSRNLSGPCADELRDCPVQKAFETGSLQKTIYTTRTGKDDEERVIETNFSPLWDEEEEVFQVIEVMRDITERRKMEEQLSHSDRLASLGLLASGISHEVRNPLATIVTGLYGLRRRLKKWPHLEAQDLKVFPKYLDLLQKEADRCKLTVDKLLMLSRKAKSDFGKVDINNTMSETISLLEHEASENDIQIIKELPSDLPFIMADESEMRQVFLNMILNGIQAIGEQGTIKIKTQREDAQVRISISDSGCGIPKEDLQRIFEPFFTKKPVGEGTGLGLFICHTIVKKHRGEITVKSQLGQGTTFEILLPISQDG
ncbi:MAG: PAS domain-containing sensor histidine kinase, partial [Candidatus Zixiibacteriota bacterium]